MPALVRCSRRHFLKSTSLLMAGACASRLPLASALAAPRMPLAEFSYGDVTLTSEPHNRQRQQTIDILMGLNDDALLMPFRAMSGQPAPGRDLGGWYCYNPDFNANGLRSGFAPGATFGQWVSALARAYAVTGDPQYRERVLRLNQLYAQTISGSFYEKTRFPAYTYDKLVCGLIDSHSLAGDSDAFRMLELTTNTALPHLPGKAIEHGQSWRPGTDESYTWDESYTMPENLFLAYQRGAGHRYRQLGIDYLDHTYFDPLSENRSNLSGRHAYSHVNALSSAAQAYLTLNDEKYLLAAQNAFSMLLAQSYATGGWGPNESLLAPNSPDLAASLVNEHHTFETPCGSYAHFKITRYLLRITHDSRYGDSMERVMYNTVLGARPLEADGHAFYYSDYTFHGSKFFHDSPWPCCSGTLPQVVADYGINCYLHDERGVYVNLYVPSSLRWSRDGRTITLRQQTEYPFESAIRFELQLAHPQEFALNFRIPAWAENPSLSVNGKRWKEPLTPGTFATLKRRWKNDDRIDLDLPLIRRLEPIDAAHTDTVALLQGPLVLFPIVDGKPEVTRQQLLAAKNLDQRTWQMETAAGPIRLLPFTAIQNETYSTYLVVR